MIFNRIIFLGSPEFAVPSLAKIYEVYKTSLIAIFTRFDQKKGRNLQLSATPVKLFAQEKKLQIYQPATKEELAAQIQQLNPDLIIVAAYGMIIPKSITDNYFCLNIHPSLLPKYRGAAPIQTALLNQDQVTGTTLMQVNEFLDQGPILWQKQVAILPADNLGSLSEKLALISAEELLNYLTYLKNQTEIKYEQQEDSLASYSTKILPIDLNLNCAKNKEEFIAKVKAFSPKPGAFFSYQDKRYKILAAHLENDELVIEQIQPEGKKVMSYKEFLLGHAALDLYTLFGGL